MIVPSRAVPRFYPRAPSVLRRTFSALGQTKKYKKGDVHNREKNTAEEGGGCSFPLGNWLSPAERYFLVVVGSDAVAAKNRLHHHTFRTQGGGAAYGGRATLPASGKNKRRVFLSLGVTRDYLQRVYVLENSRTAVEAWC